MSETQEFDFTPPRSADPSGELVDPRAFARRAPEPADDETRTVTAPSRPSAPAGAVGAPAPRHEAGRTRRRGGSGQVLGRYERRILARRLAGDSHQLSTVVESLAATQAALADMLTGRAGELRRELRDARRRVTELAGSVRGLQVAMDTVRRDGEDLRGRLAERDGQIAELQTEYRRLLDSQTGEAARSVDDERVQLFAALGQMLVQLPTVRQAVDDGKQVGAKDILGMLKPLDAAVAQLGFEPIGKPGEVVAYDEQRHQPAGGSARVPQAGENVKVRFVGFRYKEQILRKAQVEPAG